LTLLRPGAPVTVRVPATSANLGPGFDSFGLALDLHDEVTVRVSEVGLRVEIVGEGAPGLARDESHLVVRSIRECLSRIGIEAPGLEIACTNRIPHGRGLGSSSAAIVAGVLGARALVADGCDLLDDRAVLALACELEGHPDNVAACLRGGFTLAWTQPGGPEVVRLTPSVGIVAVAFVPAGELSTKRARGMLPESVPHTAAATNSARAALLVHALTARPDLLLVATEDRLHQEYRRAAMPESLDLMHRLRADSIPATVSGAGPTVLALVAPDDVARAKAVAPAGWRVERLAIDLAGATVVTGS
jgi:homoserine kinase